MIRSAVIQIICFCLLPLLVFAQSGEEEEDPFKNDPFFSKPLKEFFDKSGEDSVEKDRERDASYYFGRLNENGIDFDSGLEAGPYNSNPLYGIYPNLPMIHFNRVNGIFFGLRKERMQWYNRDWLFGIQGIQPQGLIGYSFGQKEWQYIFGVEKFLGRKKHIMIGGEFHDAATTDDYWRVGLTETTITSLVGGFDYLDYYKQRGFGFYVIARSDRLFEGGIAYSDDEYSSMQRETTFSLFGKNSNYRLNPPIDLFNSTPIDTADLESIFLSATFNPKRLVLKRYFTFSASGIIEFSDLGGSDADYGFNKYTGELNFFLNFERGGLLKYRFKAGSITGRAPDIRNFELGGIGTLRAEPFKSLRGNQMLLSNTEIHFGSPSFRAGDWLDFDDFSLMFFLDSGWTNFSQDLVESDNPFEGFSDFKFSDLSHSAGIGAGSSLVRAELAWDLDNTSRAPVFWIRLNPTF